MTNNELLERAMHLLNDVARGDKRISPYQYGELAAIIEHHLGLTEEMDLEPTGRIITCPDRGANVETEKEISVRIHYDWWGKCRTCKHWQGNRVDPKTLSDGTCQSGKSQLSQQQTTWNGHCNMWDTYDIDTAIEVLAGDWDHIHNPPVAQWIRAAPS